MKITTTAECNIEEDGVDEIITITRSVDTVYDLLAHYSSSAKAIGFPYVHVVGFANERGEQTWSKF